MQFLEPCSKLNKESPNFNGVLKRCLLELNVILLCQQFFNKYDSRIQYNRFVSCQKEGCRASKEAVIPGIFYIAPKLVELGMRQVYVRMFGIPLSISIQHCFPAKNGILAFQYPFNFV